MQTWRETIRPVTDKLDLGAKFNSTVVMRTDACASVSITLKRMADIIDQEIVRREKRRVTVRLLGIKITLERDSGASG